MPPGSPTSGVGRLVADRYLLLNRLGSGGMGHVWLAHDRRLACDVALKEIAFRDPDEAGAEREERVARARAEARHAAGLRGHPHVVTVHDVLEHEGLPWIVMEYVPGAVDLRELVARHGPLSPAECARVGLAVLDALTAGHERGVLHRDVKPANILLAPERTGAPHGRVLLADYGISLQPDTGETRYTMSSMLVGTAGYLAPERATGGPPTPAADLFSLGCTLYYGVEGCGPFERASHLAEITAVVTQEPRPAVRAGALGPVLTAFLTKDPAQRIGAAEAEAALALIVAPQPQPEPYARTATDLGSQPHWSAPGPPSPPPPGPAPGPPPPSPGPAPGPAPGPPSPRGSGPRPARRRGRVRQAVLAVLAGLLGSALVLGGTWYALTHQVPGGPVGPYGDVVGLTAPLRDGDCVLASWSGGVRFTGTPRLTLDPTCRDKAPDGQVMAFVAAGTAAEARRLGPQRCEERTRGVREGLADVRSVAVVPTAEGFVASGRRTACLLLGAHGPVYGPLGGHRRLGSAFTEVETMQRRDCLETRSGRGARLVSCAGAHDEMVLGFTRMGDAMTFARARTASDDACARDVPPADYGFDPSVYGSGSWTSEGPWKSGTHFAVCTVRRQNGGTMEGDEP
ncbi:septum formation family protein [Streptomyces actuosus]|uniref:non-specific serine/threonine protein kinase n=1 Tax=Streptomyces actuosus TaxID=1885 RepID=A0ABS2VWI1_STRAS|nr:serine/threonine-protein kinase [Streptomyces actuosus]MBN0047488.1 septum formation family protein [Streptomyces actuosus]